MDSVSMKYKEVHEEFRLKNIDTIKHNIQTKAYFIGNVDIKQLIIDSIKNSYPDGLIQLIQAGYRINVIDEDGTTALEKAFLQVMSEQSAYEKYEIDHINDSEEIVKILIRNGAKINTRLSDGDTPFGFAMHIKNYEIQKILIEYGFDPNSTNTNGVPVLVRAISYDDYEAVDLLLNAGANPNVVCGNRRPLYHARSENKQRIVNLLLRYRARE